MSQATFVTRPLTIDDSERYVETINAISAYLGIGDRIEAKSAELEWQEPGFDLTSSSLGIFDSKGLLAGYATFSALTELPVRPGFGWGVHPDYHPRELETQLFSWAAEKSQEVIGRCPPEARISVQSGAQAGYAFAESALQNAGFTKSRSYYDMEIKLDARPVPPPLPAGIIARPYRHEADLPTLVEVVRDSFSDHYGHIERSFERDLEIFRHWLENDPNYDPELIIFPVAEDTGEVVGSLVGLKQDYRDPDAGYIDTVGVRKAYRRRGLASAMLRQSFAMFWDRGTKTVHLDVDGESLTNAVALYERAGMQVYQRYNVYEKVLREGVELAKVAME